MMQSSVTDLHLCQHCQRLMAYNRSGKTFAYMVGIEGNGVFPGKKFHEFLSRFMKDAAGYGDKKNYNSLLQIFTNKKSDNTQPFFDFITSTYYYPFIIEHAQKITPEQLNSLTAGVEKWVNYLLGFINPILSQTEEPENILASVFHNAETLIKSQYAYNDNEIITITGKPDGLLFDPISNEAIILEFKGHLASDKTQDLTQAALYAWLVNTHTGLIPKVDIIYLEEDKPLAQYSWEYIKQFIDQLPFLFDAAREVIESKKPLRHTLNRELCLKCPFNDSCDDDWGERSFPFVRDPNNEVKQLAQELINVLDKHGLPSKLDGYIKGPQFFRIKIIPDFTKKVTVAKIIRKSDDLQVALNLPTAPIIRPQGGHISIDIPRKNRDIISIDSFINNVEYKLDDEVIFPLGVNINGEPFWVNIADPTMTSILVGGMSGSGKSVLLRSILVCLGLIAPINTISFTLIDPKRVTFTDIIDLPCLNGPVLMDPEKVIQSLEMAVDEMESRYREFEKNKVSDIIKYNALEKGFFKRRVIIVDEYADLILDKQSKVSLETAIQRLGQKGRAAGFHLILATQRPDAKIVTGVIKANLQLKVCLKVNSAINSKIILDEGGGESLMGFGDMLVGGSIGVQRLQAPFVSDDDINKLKEKYSGNELI